MSRPLVQTIVTAPVRFARDWLVRFVGLQGFDRAVAIAGQAFTALIPLLIVYSALVTKAGGQDFADRLIDTFNLSGDAARSVRALFAPAGDVEAQVSALGALLLVASALAFTRALQRLYQLAWDQPPLGVRAAIWGLIWLAVVVVAATVRPLILGWTDGVAHVLASIALGSLLWLVTPYVLLARRVAWRRLVPAALLTATGMAVLGLCSAVWMPYTVSSSAERFGAIGVAFALLSWLVATGLVLVGAAAAGAVIDERRRAPRDPTG